MKGEPQPTQSSQSFREILRFAEERGKEIRVKRAKERAEAIAQRIAQLRNQWANAKKSVVESWQSVKETGGKIVDTCTGLVESSQTHAEIKEYIRRKILEGRDNLRMRFNDIRDDFNNRRERAENAARERISETRRRVNERIVRPTVEGAKRVGNAVIEGAKKGVFYTAVIVSAPVVVPVVGTYIAGRAAIEGGKRVIEEGKQLASEVKAEVGQKVEEAREKAGEWGRRLKNFFVTQGERVKQEIQISVAEVKAVGYTLSTLPDQLRDQLIQARERLVNARTEAKVRRYNKKIEVLEARLRAATERKEAVVEKGTSAAETLTREREGLKARIQARMERAHQLKEAAQDLRIMRQG